MGSAASVELTPVTELQRIALQLTGEEREKLLEAVEKAEQAQEVETPYEGEQVLLLWGESQHYRPRNLLSLGGKEWQPVWFKKVNPDGTYALKHGSKQVKREHVRRYPQGMRPPEIAGITMQQLREMYEQNKEWLETPKWNPHARKMQLPTMYDVVPTIVKPATSVTKGSYAELCTQKAVDVFVSHWWGHEFAEFVRALQHAALELVHLVLKDRNPDSLVFWICSFANAQWTVNLGESLASSPFERALASQSCKAVVMVMDEQAMPLTRIWCIYEVLRTSVLRRPFFIATNDGLLLGERVPQSPCLAKTLLALAEKLLDLQPTEALASKEEDRLAIVDAVSDAVGVPQFALAVQSIMFEVLRKAGYALFSRNWGLNFRLLQVHRTASREVYWLQEKKFRARDDEPPAKRSFFHRAAQEGRHQQLIAMLEEDARSWQAVKDLRQQRDALLGKGFEFYTQRRDLDGQSRELLQQVQARKDELGQEGIHLAARYADVETFQLLAQDHHALLRHRDLLGRLPLHRAAESGKAELVAAVAAFYEPHEILEELDRQQHSALDLAVLSGSLRAVKALGVDASSCARGKKRSALHLAAQWNHAELLQALVGLGFDCNGGDSDETRPLHLAARFGHLAAVEMLVGLGADLAAATRYGRTSLHWAALNGHAEVAEVLLKRSCPIDERDNAGWTAFHWTLRRCHAACSRVLMRCSADLQLLDLKSQRGSLHLASCFNVEPELIEELVERETKLGLVATDVSGKTPLHLSAQWGTVQVAAKLLELRSDLEMRCSHQRTPLYLSARRGNAAVAQQLLWAQAELGARDVLGVAPIFAAARHGHFVTVRLLLQHHADVTDTEKDGMTVFHWAAKHGNCEALRALVASSATSAFELVAAQTRHGRTALHVACFSGRAEAVKVLLQMRSDPTLRQKDGWMAIHLAARFGRLEVVEAMIEAECDPGLGGVYGKTAAHCLIQRNKLVTYVHHYSHNKKACLQLYDFFRRDDGGRSILHTAAVAGHHRYFTRHFLLWHKQQSILALISQDDEGRTPLHLAAAKGQHLVVKEILQVLLDDTQQYDLRWDLKTEYPRYDQGRDPADLEELLREEPPANPLLMADHMGRLPLHLAAKSGFAQVTGMLARFMLQKLGDVEHVEARDKQGRTALQLALSQRRWEAARRLVSWLGLEEPAELQEANALDALKTPPGSQVWVKEATTTESGISLQAGDEGILEGCAEKIVTMSFALGSVSMSITMSVAQFSQSCVVEKSYLLNGSCWNRRARRPYPHLTTRTSEPREPLALDDHEEGDECLSVGDVVQGFDEGKGWLRLLSGYFLPQLVRLDEMRLVPALTPWQGPPLRSGQLVRTGDSTTYGRTVLPARAVGVVLRIEEQDAAVLDFGKDRVRLPGKSFEDLELLTYVSILEEPRGVPEDGIVAASSKREKCGEVERMGPGRHSSSTFQLRFPDGSTSIRLSERRGLREIAHRPTAAQLADFVRSKELRGELARMTSGKPAERFGRSRTWKEPGSIRMNSDGVRATRTSP